MNLSRNEAFVLVCVTAVLLAIVSPMLHQTLEQRKTRICLHNRQKIMEAKENWAKAGGLVNFGEPTKQQLLPFLPDSVWPTCPSYGPEYKIGRVGHFPTCSYLGHRPEQ